MDLLWKPIGDIILVQDQVNVKSWNKVGSMSRKRVLEKKKLWEHSPPQKRFECKTVTQANFPSVAWKTSMYILSPSLFYELLRSMLPFTLWIVTELNKWTWASSGGQAPPKQSLSLLTPKFKQVLYANFLFYPKYFFIIFIFI